MSLCTLHASGRVSSAVLGGARDVLLDLLAHCLGTVGACATYNTSICLVQGCVLPADASEA